MFSRSSVRVFFKVVTLIWNSYVEYCFIVCVKSRRGDNCIHINTVIAGCSSIIYLVYGNCKDTLYIKRAQELNNWAFYSNFRLAQQPYRKSRMQERWARMREEINNIHQLKDVARINAEKRTLVVIYLYKFLIFS